MDHAAIIEALGDYVAVAEVLGSHKSRTHRWKTEGIPLRHWSAVAALAKAKGVSGVTVASIAASHPSPSKEARMVLATLALHQGEAA